MYDLILEKKKSKNGVEYVNYSIDFGFKKQSITMNTSLIAVLLKISEEELYNVIKDMDVDECVKVGTYDLTFNKE